MPITCPVSLPDLTTGEFGGLDYVVMGHAFASHRELGRLADETIYQSDLTARLLSAGIPAIREVPVTVSFRGFSKIYLLDLVVGNRAIYELKTVTMLTGEHEAQLLNYLFMLDGRRGKLVNFRPASVETRFVNAPSSLAERRTVGVLSVAWQGPTDLCDLVVELLRDWGTGLELSLYRQAVIHLLGGETQVSQLLPLHRAEVELGNQRFDLVTSDAALRFTAHEAPPPHFALQCVHLLRLSPLRSLHWINIARQNVTFTTVNR